jgi:hypothetical protein
MFLGYALLLSVKVRAPAHSFLDRSAFFLWIALMCGIHFGMKAIKSRITYPRTGFLEYRKRDQIWYALLGAAFVALFILLGTVARHWRSAIVPAAYLFGPAFVASYAYNIARAVRWKWVIAGAMALSSIFIAFVPADILAWLAGLSLAAYPVGARVAGILLLSFLVYGAILLVSGGITFRNYLKNTPVLEQDAQ